jgi:GNAT superfamily N-acetyltransferase
MEAMDGPINFGDRDKWWGLMVEGFEKPPMFGMSYNPAYYEILFTNYGFQNYYNQYFYATSIQLDLPARFPERHARFAAKPDYVAKHVKLSELEKYAGDFVTVYNAAWGQHGEAKEITKEQVVKLFKTMKPIMDERLVWFAYYKTEAIGMFINIPDLNQYFKHFNGKLGWFEKLRLLYMTKTGKNKQLTGLAFGIIPKYQSLGIDSFLIQECSLLFKDKDWYDRYEMGWAGDWNPKMLNIYKSLGAQPSRRMVTFRYLFDATKPFERHPEMVYS